MLQEAFDDAPEGTEFVIRRYRCDKSNLRTQFMRILTKAGVTPWPKLFVNLRATRATELREEFPGHVVDSWIGHSTTLCTT